ncbi:MAG: GHKL domain-containing protein [Blautia sp.]|nr:GHKL domain-containing protein [Blautia sp.]
MFDALYLLYQLSGNGIILILLQRTLCTIFEKKKNANTFLNYILLVLIYWFIYYLPAMPFSLKNLLNVSIPYYYYFITSILLSFIWAFAFVKGDVMEKCAYILYFYAVYKCFKFILGALYDFQTTMDSMLYKTLDMLSFLLVFAGMLLLCRILIKHPLKFLHKLSRLEKALLLFCPISFFSLLQLADPSVNVPYIVFIPVAAFILLVNLPIIYILYVTIGEQYESRYQIERALAETSAQLTRYRYTIIMEEQARKERHELKNNYFYMQSLLKEGKTEQLEAYLANHIGDLNDGDAGLHTNNVLIDHILNVKLSYARKKAIKTYTEVLIPENLPINEEYFCTILLNLLDNAIEASLLEKDPDIQIFMNLKNKNLICSIKNKIGKNVLDNNPTLMTTKPDKKNHGLGMKIIKNRVRKLNALFDISVENNYFVATVVIPLKNIPMH